jgi:hypothetical protein
MSSINIYLNKIALLTESDSDTPSHLFLCKFWKPFFFITIPTDMNNLIDIKCLFNEIEMK